MSVLIKNAEVAGRIVDLRLTEQVAEVGANLSGPATVIDAGGCAVLPGLHDHHIHLYATAAALASVDCAAIGPDNPQALADALNAAPGGGWVRGVGYHESVAGDLDCWALDRLCGHRPVRLQHSSGKLWVLNSAALQALDLQGHPDQLPKNPGLERNATNQLTGRLWRLDDWLHARLPTSAQPSLAALSQHLASLGVTSVTDASYTNDRQRWTQYEQARRRGELLQRLYLMGDLTLPEGQLKILLDEDDLPAMADLLDQIRQAHARQRPVAFHAVSHLELLVALTALAQAGAHSGDRIEHAGVVRPEMLTLLRSSGVTVVTQPGFIADRGARFLAAADVADQPYLYPYASLLAAGIPVAASSDAPYGPIDPWRIMAAAATRSSETGEVVNPQECVSPAQALAGYLSPPAQPGGAPRTLHVGVPADLCVLDRSLQDVFADISATRVRYTLIAGQVVYDRALSTSSVCSPK